MLKGVNKKVVEVVETENDYFEKAILFIKAEKQERDEITLRQRASEYLRSIRYTPRRHVPFPKMALSALRFAAAMALGAAAAGFFLH